MAILIWLSVIRKPKSEVKFVGSLGFPTEHEFYIVIHPKEFYLFTMLEITMSMSSKLPRLEQFRRNFIGILDSQSLYLCFDQYTRIFLIVQLQPLQILFPK